MNDSGAGKPVTQILSEIKGGSRQALDELLPLVYDELRRLAGSYLKNERSNHTLQPTALVHEAYLRLLGQKEIAWQNRAHFFGVSARLMREILIEYARMKNRLKRGGEFKTQIALDDAVTKLEKLDARQARIVEMKFFAGMTIEEIAEVSEVSTATVKREWATAKLLLYKILHSQN